MQPCVLTVARWWEWHLPVGVFIAILAVLGVFVPLFRSWEKINRVEKALWTLLLFLLVGLEIRSIYLDRNEHDSEQAFARCEQLDSFQKIAAGINNAILNDKTQFNATMISMEGIIDEQQKTLTQTNRLLRESQNTSRIATDAVKAATGATDAVTGGKSYPRVYLSSRTGADGTTDTTHIWLAARIIGTDNPGGFKWEVSQLDPASYDSPENNDCAKDAPIVGAATTGETGPITPGPTHMLPIVLTPRHNAVTRYKILMDAKNGRFVQCLDVRPGPKGDWESKSIIRLGNFFVAVEDKWPD